jgi:hypothetical protein
LEHRRDIKRAANTLASSALIWWRVNRPLLSYSNRKFSFVLAMEITSASKSMEHSKLSMMTCKTYDMQSYMQNIKCTHRICILAHKPKYVVGHALINIHQREILKRYQYNIQYAKPEGQMHPPMKPAG